MHGHLLQYYICSQYAVVVAYCSYNVSTCGDQLNVCSLFWFWLNTVPKNQRYILA